MSKFKQYVQQADEAAKAAFKVRQEATERMNKAEETRRAYPKRAGLVSDEYLAKSARAEADYMEAKENLRAANEHVQSVGERMREIRRALAADLEKHYRADPSAIDAETLELLKSGILKPSEYSALYDKAEAAGNYTMQRLIGKYAQDAADAPDAKQRYTAEEASTLRIIGNDSRNVNGAEYLQGFDVIADVYNRCVRNPGLERKWDMLTNEVIDTF